MRMSGYRLAFVIAWLSFVSILCGQTWNGASSVNSNWSTTANWVGGIAPANATPGTANVHFAGTSRINPNVDTPWSISTLTFDAGAGAFNIGGSALTIAGGITNNNSGSESVLTPVVLGASQTWNAAGAALDLTRPTLSLGSNQLLVSGNSSTVISAVISGSGSFGRNTGTGTLLLNSTVSNPFTGFAFINNGTMELNTIAFAFQNAAEVFIGDGTGAANSAVLQDDQSDEFTSAHNFSVFLDADGLLNINGHTEYVGSISTVGGNIATGAGTLNLTGFGGITINPASSTTTISGNLALVANAHTFSVAAGTTPSGIDLDIPASVTNGAITKTGAGQMRFSGGASSLTLLLCDGGTTALSSGTVTINNFAAVGESAAAIFVQTGGTLALPTADLRVGDVAGSSGTYTISGVGASLNESGNIGIGHAGTGTFNQNGGSVSVALGLFLGSTPTGTGIYTMNSGTLSTQFEYVGYQGNGTFNQSGGTHTVTNTLNVGYLFGSTGTYILNTGSTLTAPFEDIGFSGSGAFFHNDGTNNVTSTLVVGSFPNSGASYSLFGGNLNANFLTVGNAAGSKGTFTQNGGSATIANGFILAGTGATGVYNLQFGTLTSNAVEFLGDGGIGTVNQTSGTHNVTAQGVQIGAFFAPGSQSTYNLSGGGSFSITGDLDVGTLDTGTVNNTGGNNSATFVYVGKSSGVTGFYNLSGSGMLSSANEFIGYAGNGVFTQNGGTNTVSNSLTIASQPGSTGVYDLNGGTLAANGLSFINNDTLALGGGTLAGNAPQTNNATISGFGVISGTGGFTNFGLIQQGAGNLALTNNGTNTNFGTINLAAGRIMQIPVVSLINNGSLNIGGAFISGAGFIFNQPGATVTGPGNVAVGFSNSGTLLVPTGTTNITSSFANSSLIRLTGGGASLNGGAITNSGRIAGDGSVGNAITNNGRIEASGTLSLGGTLTNSSTGLLTATTGSTLLVAGSFPTNAGTISLTGGSFDTNGHALSNTGQISGFGTIYTGGLTNNGTVILTGGLSTVNGAVTNAVGKTFSVQNNPAIFTGPVTNNGTFTVINSTATFVGGFSGAPVPGGISGLGDLTVSSSAIVNTDYLRQNSASIAGSVPERDTADGGDFSVLNSLSITGAGQLDLNDNDLVVNYSGASPSGTIRSYIVSGFNGGNWNGAGVDSTAAHNNSAFLTALGYADVSSTNFDGQSITHAVIVKYTYYGDSNLDGVVNTADFQMFLNGLAAAGGSSWSAGDYTYDGRVDIGNDFNLFLVGYLRQGGALGDLAPMVLNDSALSAVQKAQLLGLVPEPSSAGFIAVAAIAGARRRPRK
jgi:fibronectin-binding autotransporter adhesin